MNILLYVENHTIMKRSLDNISRNKITKTTPRLVLLDSYRVTGYEFISLFLLIIVIITEYCV